MEDKIKKILFVTDSYGYVMAPSGICVSELADIFLDKGFEVHVLCPKVQDELFEETFNKVQIHRITNCLSHRLIDYGKRKHANNWFGKVSFILGRILSLRVIPLLPFWPLKNPFYCLRFIRKGIKLQKQYRFDIIISSYAPFESLYVGLFFKKIHGVKFCTYFVDCLTDFKHGHRFLTPKFLNYHGYRHEQKIFSASDLILNLKCHKTNFEDIKYDIYKHKMRYVDIPYLKDRTTAISENYSKSTNDIINIVYTGSVREGSLQYVLQTFRQIEKVQIHFYGLGQDAIPNLNFIIKHGYVAREKIFEAQINADILISTVDYVNNTFIPSKIFEYMSTGKKIIHFCFEKQDVTFSYYSKYRNVLCIDVHNSIDETIEQIRTFIKKTTHPVSFEELREAFPENDPKYTIDVILDSLSLNT